MDYRTLLITFAVLAHVLMSTIWLIGGRWMGLSRKAAGEWLRASLACGMALILALLAPQGPGHAWLTWLVLASPALACFAAASWRSGLQHFLRTPSRAATRGKVTVLALAVSLVGTALPVPLPLGVPLVCLLTAVVLHRCAQDSHARLSEEFGAGVALLTSVQLGLMALLVSATAMAYVGNVLYPLAMPELALQRAALTLATIALCVGLTFMLGYVVVMRLVTRLRHLSQHDSLTGLLNRRAIEQLLARESHRLQRFGQSFTVLLVDIDHFKRINDHLGHAAGDEILKRVALTLHAQGREVDRVARYGGEEFCVLLANTDLEGGIQAAERLRSAIQEADLCWMGKPVAVTISTGLACAVDPNEAVSSVLARADEALYRAKLEGRNRVVASYARRAA